jgi:hypothetical protein
MIKSLKLCAGVAWAAALVASAAPADAIAVTTQYGAYASCSNAYSSIYKSFSSQCSEAGGLQPIGVSPSQTYETYYTQTIKFVDVPCGAGGCAGTGTVYTDMIYGTGRKTAEPQSLNGLCGGYEAYYLGTCAC